MVMQDLYLNLLQSKLFFLIPVVWSKLILQKTPTFRAQSVETRWQEFREKQRKTLQNDL
jgi:hypothetical protein